MSSAAAILDDFFDARPKLPRHCCHSHCLSMLLGLGSMAMRFAHNERRALAAGWVEFSLSRFGGGGTSARSTSVTSTLPLKILKQRCWVFAQVTCHIPFWTHRVGLPDVRDHGGETKVHFALDPRTAALALYARRLLDALCRPSLLRQLKASGRNTLHDTGLSTEYHMYHQNHPNSMQARISSSFFSDCSR